MFPSAPKTAADSRDFPGLSAAGLRFPSARRPGSTPRRGARWSIHAGRPPTRYARASCSGRLSHGDRAKRAKGREGPVIPVVGGDDQRWRRRSYASAMKSWRYGLTPSSSSTKPSKLESLLLTPTSSPSRSPSAVDSLHSDLAVPHRHLHFVPGDPPVRLDHFSLSLSLWSVLAPWGPPSKLAREHFFGQPWFAGRTGTDGEVGRRRRENIPMLGNGTQSLLIIRLEVTV
jgi:hypothetical protein